MLKQINSFVLLFILVTLKSAAQYSIESIPEIIKENAHCIVREYIHEIEVKSANSSVETIRKVITVLDKTGEKNAYLAIPYDKNSNVTIKKIVTYDKYGNRLKNVKLSEINDQPYSGSSELYSENRLKFYSPSNPEFPYSVEYEYVLDQTNVISYGCWRPFTTYNTSAQHAKLILIHPLDIKINIKEFDIRQEAPNVIKNKKVETWELNNLKSYEEEPFDIHITERMPRVYLMPDILNYDNYEGSATTWSDFGKWINNLYKGRDELSGEEKIKITTLLDGKTDTLDRIRTLYTYLQNNTRYVLITLGIGGFQPTDVKKVIETGYGDCKALSNYMHSLLKFIGIKSYPALVASGTYQIPIFYDFPNFQQFDHVILCVPFRNDTIWLECTNQKIPFGFLGDFTDNRSVLLISENGGKFAHTKEYNAQDNFRVCNSLIRIDSAGNASLKTETKLSGLQYDDISFLLSSNYEEQKKWLQRYSELPALKINSFSFGEERRSVPCMKIEESSVSKNYCTNSGKYMLLSLNRMNVQKPISKMLKQRFSDIVIYRSYVYYDTLVYEIPGNMTIESLPPAKNINSAFGEYSYSVSTRNNQIIYTRRLLLNQGKYKPEEYNNLYNFVLDVSKSDNIKVIITKKI